MKLLQVGTFYLGLVGWPWEPVFWNVDLSGGGRCQFLFIEWEYDPDAITARSCMGQTAALVLGFLILATFVAYILALVLGSRLGRSPEPTEGSRALTTCYQVNNTGKVMLHKNKAFHAKPLFFRPSRMCDFLHVGRKGQTTSTLSRCGKVECSVSGFFSSISLSTFPPFRTFPSYGKGRSPSSFPVSPLIGGTGKVGNVETD